MSKVPLAEQMRPTKLSDVVGQSNLIDDKGLLGQIVKTKQPASMIFWGPSGTGKTTLARIVASEVEADFIEISAVTSGIADVKKHIIRAEQNKRLGIRTIIFVDEIHRFNKAQQDAFLPHIENGLIYLIGATTENPSFEVITPLLSRTRVLILEKLTSEEIVTILQRCLKIINKTKQAQTSILKYIADMSDGDARIALGNLELCLDLAEGKITKKTVDTAVQRVLPGYDKNGEQHYNIISAFIKSMRGSDSNASLYYLARMLNAGEDPKFIARRMIIFASEDIGIASTPALNLAVSTFQAVERIGMPECQYNLFHCALVLSASKKSRVVTNAMAKAIDLAKSTPNLASPIYLRNASTSLMKDIGYGKDYQWKADFKPTKGFLPEELKDLNLFD